LITSEQVNLAYQLLLGRDPESSDIVNNLCQTVHSIPALRESFMRSPEFRSRMGEILDKHQDVQLRHPFHLPHILENEKNSRLLYEKWRPKIKDELSKIWRNLLSNNCGYEEIIDGNITSEFIRAPFSASRQIAENIILREEYRWSREIDGEDLNAGIADKISVSGVRYRPDLQGYLTNCDIEVKLYGVLNIRNFYLCGRRLNSPMTEGLEVSISVNNTQEKSFLLTSDRTINLGIIEPILYQDLENTFIIKIYENTNNDFSLEINSPILLTHFVLDDKEIKIF